MRVHSIINCLAGWFFCVKKIQIWLLNGLMFWLYDDADDGGDGGSSGNGKQQKLRKWTKAKHFNKIPSEKKG